MSTYGDKMLSDFAAASSKLTNLAMEPYETSDVRDVLSTIGAKTELFLKSIVLPGRHPRNSFEWFIDELKSAGLTQPQVDKLHSLRLRYNLAKHQPGVVIPLVTAGQSIREAESTITAIIAAHLGAVDTVTVPSLHRVFWVAAWDHYAHGDSEVHVILPVDSSHWLGPPTLDIIYIRGLEWDTVKSDLVSLGVVCDGRGVIPQPLYNRLEAEGDFAGAFVYEGDYRSLITTLASKEMRQDLIPGLNRHENSSAMINAFLLASVDAASAGGTDATLNDDILKQATQAYAVPADFRHGEYLAGGMAEMIRQVPVGDWSNLKGPTWVGIERFESAKPNAIAHHTKYKILIDQSYLVRMQWN